MIVATSMQREVRSLMPFIQLNNLTKDFGDGKGVFNLNLSIEKGEVFGFVGTNGAGKTTAIRHMMGFLKPKSGTAKISGMDCWTDAAEVKRLVGYIPGEIAFPDAPTGTEFLRRQAELLGLKDMSYAERIIKKLQLDPTANLKRMSKGMKQKVMIMNALLAEPPLYIIDEPFLGLDPLGIRSLLEQLVEVKRRGAAVLMSSHILSTVEAYCDRFIVMHHGHIAAQGTLDDVRSAAGAGQGESLEEVFYKLVAGGHS